MQFLKKNLFHFIFLLSLLSLILSSCSDDSSITEPQNKILSNETNTALQVAADKIMMTYSIPGMIACITVEGEEDLYISRGVGNLNTSEKMYSGNYFRMASVTKSFTTEAVLILVDEGKIDLNKPISFYLPEYIIPQGDKITVRMLGNMTSGLIEVIDDIGLNTIYYNSQGTTKFTSEQLIAPLSTSSLKFTPGAQFDYCNTNTIILGLLIKKVTNQEIKDVFAEKIFKPLGLINTFWPETNYLPYPYHHAYGFLTGTFTDMTYYGNSIGNAAGILISNLSDLKMWAKELSECKLLSANSKTERFQTTAGSDYSFGLDKIGDWVGHSGGIIGWNTMVYYNKAKNMSIVVHTNVLEGTPAGAAFNEFAKILNKL
ncbi:MAG: serine hydrolase domain-containing protein [Melioribacteraceae bacterium]